jgi:nucleotide-binding universal stress UspA family protein
MVERILIPLDGSPRAELILGQITRILTREDSEILLLTVVDPVLGFEQSEKAGSSMAEHQNAAQNYIDGHVRHLVDQGAKARGRVVVGPTSESILKVAKEEGSTMIAMTTHGRSGLSRCLMGSVAEEVLHAGNVPVLLVRSIGSTPQEPVQQPGREAKERCR